MAENSLIVAVTEEVMVNKQVIAALGASDEVLVENNRLIVVVTGELLAQTSLLNVASVIDEVSAENRVIVATLVSVEILVENNLIEVVNEDPTAEIHPMIAVTGKDLASSLVADGKAHTLAVTNLHYSPLYFSGKLPATRSREERDGALVKVEVGATLLVDLVAFLVRIVTKIRLLRPIRKLGELKNNYYLIIFFRDASPVSSLILSVGLELSKSSTWYVMQYEQLHGLRILSSMRQLPMSRLLSLVCPDRSLVVIAYKENDWLNLQFQGVVT